MDEACASIIVKRNACKVLVGKEINCLAGLVINWSVLEWVVGGGVGSE
jgi:hypothetical protein